jgi:hypothetical protein
MKYGPRDEEERKQNEMSEEDAREKANEGNDKDEYPPENMPDPD